MSALKLQNLSKRFKDTFAVREVSLDIKAGEFFSILGPSGCGKTTLLRTIAGFESPTAGKVLLNGKDITHTSPQSRAIGMVFQNYALFPHMTVYQNVAFGLETMKVPKREVRSRVERILDAVQLGHKIDTPVPHLSGGEQQRVAVARALIVEPAVLLFDEPLSNLDAALRAQTREEIRTLQRKTKITTIYVTHDQSEAMSLSDRIAVMQEGRVEQIGTPSELYESPHSTFVARFLGGANIVKGTITSTKERFRVQSLDLPLRTASSYSGSVTVAIKPEAITLVPQGSKADCEAVVEAKEYLGFVTNMVINAEGVPLRVSSISSDFMTQLVPGSRVSFRIDWQRCNFFQDQDNEANS